MKPSLRNSAAFWATCRSSRSPTSPRLTSEYDWIVKVRDWGAGKRRRPSPYTGAARYSSRVVQMAVYGTPKKAIALSNVAAYGLGKTPLITVSAPIVKSKAEHLTNVRWLLRQRVRHLQRWRKAAIENNSSTAYYAAYALRKNVEDTQAYCNFLGVKVPKLRADVKERMVAAYAAVKLLHSDTQSLCIGLVNEAIKRL